MFFEASTEIGSQSFFGIVEEHLALVGALFSPICVDKPVFSVVKVTALRTDLRDRPGGFPRLPLAGND